MTTLAVKERSTAHNPLGAIYSNYYRNKISKNEDIEPNGNVAIKSCQLRVFQPYLDLKTLKNSNTISISVIMIKADIIKEANVSTL